MPNFFRVHVGCVQFMALVNPLAGDRRFAVVSGEIILTAGRNQFMANQVLG